MALRRWHGHGTLFLFGSAVRMSSKFSEENRASMREAMGGAVEPEVGLAKAFGSP